MAENRTDWAEDRTVLANERTFAGWMRTGMASVALAVGLKAVFGPFQPTWIAKSISLIFILTAILIFQSARRRACKTVARLNDHRAEPVPQHMITLLSFIFSVAAGATGIVLWLL
ncbi:YidH family protein [Sedimentitalea nanhaiensis]|nr:DUF202 domain-containing protein [Sedimentitalea nanhaiensis]